MKKTIYLIMIAVAAFTMGCTDKKEDNSHHEQQATRLFSEICKTAIAYTDSMRQANDSARINQLNEGFEKSLRRINASIEPNTDLYLNMMQNDSLNTLIMLYDSVHKSKIASVVRVDPDTTDLSSPLP